MAAAEPSQAEIEAAAEALHRLGWGGNDGVAAKFWAKMSEREKAEWFDIARVVLTAVLPLVEARIRAELADELEALRDSDQHYERCSLTEAAAFVRGGS